MLEQGTGVEQLDLDLWLEQPLWILDSLSMKHLDADPSSEGQMKECMGKDFTKL